MRQRTLGLLIFVIGFLAVLTYLNRPDFAQPETGPALEGLESALNDINQVVVTGAGNQTIATLNRGPSGWTVAERDDYAADVGKLRKTLIGLANAKNVEQKTTNPDLYEQLGLRDIDNPDAGGVQLDIVAPEKSFRVLIGKTGVRGALAYSRIPGQAQSYLISADLDLAKDTADWLDKSLVDIAAEDIHSVAIRHADGDSIVLTKPSRDETDFVIDNKPADRELSYASVANSIGQALSGLQLDDVVATDVSAEEAAVVSRFVTFDGLDVTLSTFAADERELTRIDVAVDDEIAARFAASTPSTAPEAEPETKAPGEPVDDGAAAVEPEKQAEPAAEVAARLNTRFKGRLFELPAAAADQITRRMDDLLQDET